MTAQQRPTILAFRSAHGGTGQTTLCAHVALGLARTGRQVLLLEIQKPSIAAHYLPAATISGQPATPVALGSLSADTRQVEKNLWHATLDPRNSARIAALAELSRRSSSRDFWLVVDLPRHLDLRQELALEPTVEIQVLRADPSSLVNLTDITDNGDLYVLLNQIDARRPISRDIDRVLSTLLKDRLLSRIHYDEAVPEALGRQSNLFDSAPASQATLTLTRLVEKIASTASPAAPIVASRTGD